MSPSDLSLAPSPQAPVLSVSDAFARYEAIRCRLPTMRGGQPSRQAPDLMSVAEEFDGFLFDSFGVLNVGETAIPGAAACLSALRRAGKRICILTNAASYPADTALSKYRRMGLDVRREEIVSSRDVALAHLTRVAPGRRWGAIAAEEDGFDDIRDATVFDLLAPGASWDRAEGFLFLSSARWTPALQDRLVQALSRHPRPVVIANPDLVAPRETGLTLEPGFWAHDLQDRTGLAPRFFGKPYPEAFTAALDQLGPGRYAMVGDTLHTDILGGQAAGLATVLVTRHGIFSGCDVGPYVGRSGIVPDIVVPAI